MSNIFKDILGATFLGPEYVGHRLLGDKPSAASRHVLADAFLGGPWSLMRHAANDRDFGCRPAYSTDLARYFRSGACATNGAMYAAGYREGFAQAYLQAYSQLLRPQNAYVCW